MPQASMRAGHSPESGNMRGRNERLCGQMGVTRMQGTWGCTMEPPAARLYAVEPVGVATIRPSPCRQERKGGKERVVGG